LERATTTSKMGNQSVSTATSMAIWPKNAEEERERNQEVFQM